MVTDSTFAPTRYPLVQSQLRKGYSVPFRLSRATPGKWAFSASMLGIFAFLLTTAPLALSQSPAAIDPKATYLLTRDDPGAVPALIIPLASLGIRAGDTITIQTQGDFSFCFPSGCPEIQGTACGVFSSNARLLPAHNLHRVVGALPVTADFVSPCVTAPTLFGQIPTDIPEDFYIDGSSMTVPNGAHYLFVAVADIFYGDNADPNGNFAVV